MVLDLREVGYFGLIKGITGLEIEYVLRGKQKESPMQSLRKHPDQKEKKSDSDEENENDENEEGSEEEDFEEGDFESRIKLITVSAFAKYEFDLYYSPPAIAEYEFELPITVKGYGPWQGITRMVCCSGEAAPDLVIQPSLINFKKKIISKSMNSSP